MSGQLDSNQRPPAPKAGILTGLNYAPNFLFQFNFSGFGPATFPTFTVGTF